MDDKVHVFLIENDNNKRHSPFIRQVPDPYRQTSAGFFYCPKHIICQQEILMRY